MYKKRPSKKAIVKIPKEKNPTAKQRKAPVYKSLRLHKSIKHPAPKIANWWELTRKAFRLLLTNKKQLAVFFIVYGLLSLVLVRGFSSPIALDGVEDTFNEVLDEETAGLATGIATFGLLVTASTQGSDDITQLYQLVLLVIGSLAVVWLFRQQQSGNRVTMKMAFYRGMYPLIPFVLVALVIALQLIPMALGNFLYSTVTSNDLVVGFLEHASWLLVFLSTILLSLYMLSSSLMALYIVTLPEMTPMRALKEARALVLHRRMQVMRKLLALVIVLFLIIVILVLPIIFVNPAAAEWLYFTLGILAIPFVHGYLFSLYRELL